MQSRARHNAIATCETADCRSDSEVQILKPIAWMQSLESGNTRIDREHQALITQCNALTHLAVQGAGSEALKASIAEIAASLARHFEAEEEILLATNFERLDAHIREHRRICARIEDMRNQAAAAARSAELFSIACEVRELLLDLLLRHDLDFKSHLHFWRSNQIPDHDDSCKG